MQLVVSQLVFASSTRGTTEILHDRRKVMVMLLKILQVLDIQIFYDKFDSFLEKKTYF